MGALHLIRHADAGHAPDEFRHLSDAGQRQADRITAHLAGVPISRVLSSRYQRCMDTVTPLAAQLGLEVETHDALAEEADLDDMWQLLESLVDRDVVVCSHGNLIAPALDRVLRRGAVIEADEWSCHKGSIWRLEKDEDRPIARAVLVVSRA